MILAVNDSLSRATKYILLFVWLFDEMRISTVAVIVPLVIYILAWLLLDQSEYSCSIIQISWAPSSMISIIFGGLFTCKKLWFQANKKKTTQNRTNTTIIISESSIRVLSNLHIHPINHALHCCSVSVFCCCSPLPCCSISFCWLVVVLVWWETVFSGKNSRYRKYWHLICFVCGTAQCPHASRVHQQANERRFSISPHFSGDLYCLSPMSRHSHTSSFMYVTHRVYVRSASQPASQPR